MPDVDVNRGKSHGNLAILLLYLLYRIQQNVIKDIIVIHISYNPLRQLRVSCNQESSFA